MRISRKARRELTLILLFLISLPLMYVLFFGDGGYLKLRESREELEALQMENRRLREEHLRFLERIDRLRNDPAEIERIAREKYDFARPGDIIVNLSE